MFVSYFCFSSYKSSDFGKLDLPGVTFIFSLASSGQFSTLKDVLGKNLNMFVQKGITMISGREGCL